MESKTDFLPVATPMIKNAGKEEEIHYGLSKSYKTAQLRKENYSSKLFNILIKPEINCNQML